MCYILTTIYRHLTLQWMYTLVLGLSWVHGHGDASLADISEYLYAKPPLSLNNYMNN